AADGAGAADAVASTIGIIAGSAGPGAGTAGVVAGWADEASGVAEGRNGDIGDGGGGQELERGNDGLGGGVDRHQLRRQEFVHRGRAAAGEVLHLGKRGAGGEQGGNQGDL